MATSLYIGIIFLFASLIQGFTGFGLALIAIPLLCLVVDIKIAVPLCTLIGIIITAILLFQLKQHSDLKKIMPLCLSAIPGVLVGTTLLRSVDSGLIRVLLGLLLVAYSTYSLVFTPKPLKLHKIWAWIAGFSSGTLGAALSTGGPPTIIYTTLNNWKKNEIKATITGFFLFNSCIVAVAHVLSGVTTWEVISLFLAASPFVVVGTLIGSGLYNLLPGKNYITLIFSFLIIMGLVMIFGS